MNFFIEVITGQGICNTYLLQAHEKSLDNTLREERKVFVRDREPRSEGCIVLKHKFNARDRADRAA